MLSSKSINALSCFLVFQSHTRNEHLTTAAFLSNQRQKELNYTPEYFFALQILLIGVLLLLHWAIYMLLCVLLAFKETNNLNGKKKDIRLGAVTGCFWGLICSFSEIFHLLTSLALLLLLGGVSLGVGGVVGVVIAAAVHFRAPSFLKLERRPWGA